MKLGSRCIPCGDLPYENINSATRTVAKLYEKCPYIPLLPKLDVNDSILKRTLSNIPRLAVTQSGKIAIKSEESYEHELKLLDKAFNSPKRENLRYFGFDAVFLEKFLQMINKFKSPNACVNLMGPFTLLHTLQDAASEQMVADKTFRKLIIQAVSVKALWIIDKIKEYNPNTVPIIMFEEPVLNKIGDLKRENAEVTIDLIVSLFSKVFEKIKQEGGAVGFQSFDKCDWQIPIKAGVVIISFDAYNNPSNLTIIPETITDFIQHGGKINWAIVPTTSESIVKSLNIDYITKRLLGTLDGLAISGVPHKYVYNSAVVSVQGNPKDLPLIFAEKTMILATQLSKKIPVIT